MTDRNLGPLLDAGTVAVVGATPDTKRLGGGVVLDFLLRYGFAGIIYPVNPKYKEVLGLPCYPDLTAIPDDVDVAILSVPAKALNSVIAAVPEGKIKTAVVLTSGFSELGEAGKALEVELLATARAKKVRLVGPNSVGIANLASGLVPSISQFFDRGRAKPGPIALISQSGAFGTAILAQAEHVGINFGYFVSSGNEADLEFSDFGSYLVERDDVQIICGYIESIRDGAAFMKFANRARELGKPVVVLKVGTSDIGAEAARSHTGALVGSDAVAQAVFDACGVVRATDGEHLLDLLSMLSKMPAARGMRMAVLSHSGGAAVLAADAASNTGAELPPLPDDLRQDLASRLPAFAAVRNPLDMTGGVSLNARLMTECLEAVLAHDAFDSALLCVNLIWREGA
ncbi:MAG: acetate--CoA ligase family protein, partial [Hyphomicrobiales bacterium]